MPAILATCTIWFNELANSIDFFGGRDGGGGGMGLGCRGWG